MCVCSRFIFIAMRWEASAGGSARVPVAHDGAGRDREILWEALAVLRKVKQGLCVFAPAALERSASGSAELVRGLAPARPAPLSLRAAAARTCTRVETGRRTTAHVQRQPVYGLYRKLSVFTTRRLAPYFIVLRACLPVPL